MSEKRRKMLFRLSEKANEALRVLEVYEGKKIPIHIVVKALIGGVHPHELYKALISPNYPIGRLFLKAADQFDKRCSRNRSHIGIDFFESEVEQLKNVRQILFTLDWANESKTPRVLTGSKVINRLLIMAAYEPEAFKTFSQYISNVK